MNLEVKSYETDKGTKFTPNVRVNFENFTFDAENLTNKNITLRPGFIKSLKKNFLLRSAVSLPLNDIKNGNIVGGIGYNKKFEQFDISLLWFESYYLGWESEDILESFFNISHKNVGLDSWNIRNVEKGENLGTTIRPYLKIGIMKLCPFRTFKPGEDEKGVVVIFSFPF